MIQLTGDVAINCSCFYLLFLVYAFIKLKVIHQIVDYDSKFKENNNGRISLMKQKNHDTLVYRLAQILIKLNQGEKLNPKTLANEFGVSMRTIQRDLNVRFAYLPLEKNNEYYQLDVAFLGKLNSKDIERFASLAGIKGLFPSLNEDFLRDIFDFRIQDTILVKGHFYENINNKEKLFKEIESAIISRLQVAFEYNNGEIKKYYNSISPYKLINNKGIWYLAALDKGKLKTFSFSKIDNLNIIRSTFLWDSSVDLKLNDADCIWLAEENIEITLSVNKEIAGYFKRRQLISNQKIQKELEDGGLIVSTRGHINHIFPIIRYWIPNIKIISPQSLQQELVKELDSYIKLN